jgi:hypothetical protein
MNSSLSTSRTWTGRGVLAQLSLPLVGLAAAALVTGVAVGGSHYLDYLDRSPIRAGQSPGTSAWWPHIVLFVVAVALLVGARLRRHRGRHRAGVADGGLLLLAPLGKSAAWRVRYAMSAAARGPGELVRLMAATPLVALLGYCLWRAGYQVLGGLDPNFTANAWGGPSYLGAMACHYLDLGLIMAACGWLLDRLLPARSVRPSDQRAGEPR